MGCGARNRNLEMGGAREPCPLSVVLSSCRRPGSVPVVWLEALEVWGTRYSLFGGKKDVFLEFWLRSVFWRMESRKRKYQKSL